jgi:hypothetical protein
MAAEVTSRARAEGARGREYVGRVPHEEDSPGPVLVRDPSTERATGDLLLPSGHRRHECEVKGWIADREAGKFNAALFGEVVGALALVGVVGYPEKPSSELLHWNECRALPWFVEVGEQESTFAHCWAEVGIEDEVRAMEEHTGTIRSNAKLVAYACAMAIRGDQVLCVDAILDTAVKIAHYGRQSVGIGDEGDQLSAKPHVGAAPFGAVAYDALQFVLVDDSPIDRTHRLRRANIGEQIDSEAFFTSNRLRTDHLGKIDQERRAIADRLFQAEGAVDLHGTRVEGPRLGHDCGGWVPLDQHRTDSLPGKEKRRRESRNASSHDEHGGLALGVPGCHIVDPSVVTLTRV